TEAGLKAVFKDFNLSGENLVKRLKTFREHGVHVLGSFIFGLPSDREDTFQATFELASKADLTFAQFVMMTPFPGTVDFQRWEKSFGDNIPEVEGVPITRYWRIPAAVRPKMFTPHPTMEAAEIQRRTQHVWDQFYSWGEIWKRSNCVKSLKARVAFVLISKLYRQMYANTGISTDSARREKANRMARIIARYTRGLFRAQEMPSLEMPPRALEAHLGQQTGLGAMGLVTLGDS
ncbi:MAG: radical SAM protein, partial [Bryobacterales bacterium]|nr:radical SAM protein [Bryobacterales bacterium]